MAILITPASVWHHGLCACMCVEKKITTTSTKHDSLEKSPQNFAKEK